MLHFDSRSDKKREWKSKLSKLERSSSGGSQRERQKERERERLHKIPPLIHGLISRSPAAHLAQCALEMKKKGLLHLLLLFP